MWVLNQSPSSGILPLAIDLASVGNPMFSYVPTTGDLTMYEFDIPDMTCGHCAGTVTKAIMSVDPAAVPKVDLNTRKATVETKADPDAIGAALDEAGYPATYRAA
jgi:copper chaperone